jgi:hypothetical protein
MKPRYFPIPSNKCGVLAQLVERLNGIEEVRGSNPLGSTSLTYPQLGRVRLRPNRGFADNPAIQLYPGRDKWPPTKQALPYTPYEELSP